MLIARIASISLLTIAGWGVSGVALADFIDTSNPADCTAEFPTFESFEDGSSGCFKADLPGLQEWAPGEFEKALARESHMTPGLPKTGN